MNEAFDTLRETILSLVPMPPADLEGVVAHFDVRFVPRNGFLLRKGHPCLFWGFIHSGLVRSYTIGRNGDEHTNWLISKGGFVTEYVSFLQQTPSVVNAHALEDTTLVVTDYERLQRLYERYPLFERFARLRLEKAMVAIKENARRRAHQNATERYQHLLDTQPDLVQRVPLMYVASWLGITESSLSRIRRAAPFLPNGN